VTELHDYEEAMRRVIAELPPLSDEDADLVARLAIVREEIARRNAEIAASVERKSAPMRDALRDVLRRIGPT
jgi:hypothetical protein